MATNKDAASTAANESAAVNASASVPADGAANNPGASVSASATANENTLEDKLGLNQQIVRFIITGGMSAVVDFGSTALFTFLVGWGDTTSKAIGFILGTLTAYFINRRWTFQAEPSTWRFIITMITYVITFAVQVGLYKLCIPWLEGLDLSAFWVRAFSFVIAQGTATVINFAIQRFVIFRQ